MDASCGSPSRFEPCWAVSRLWLSNRKPALKNRKARRRSCGALAWMRCKRLACYCAILSSVVIFLNAVDARGDPILGRHKEVTIDVHSPTGGSEFIYENTNPPESADYLAYIVLTQIKTWEEGHLIVNDFLCPPGAAANCLP